MEHGQQDLCSGDNSASKEVRRKYSRRSVPPITTVYSERRRRRSRQSVCVKCKSRYTHIKIMVFTITSNGTVFVLIFFSR